MIPQLKIFLLIILTHPCFSQKKTTDIHEHDLHLVEFKDKIGSPYSVFRPQDFLSTRALERRVAQGISIDISDLPLSTIYTQTIAHLAPIHSQSRWFNALAIHTESIATLEKIKALPFVKSVLPLGKFRSPKEGKIYTKRPEIDSSKHQKNHYGLAENQTSMLNGIALHQLGFTGKNIHIAVVDGGFNNVYRMSVFDSLYLEDRMLGTHDFVEGDDYVYEASTHGTGVLSTMAAKRPNLMVGTAPDASYYLFKTEDVQGEYRAEEFYWVLAMEYADSLGVDVVNSSMGYNRFRDTSMSYNYVHLDGQTAMITRGANIAISKGLLIVNAAGNDGHQDWHYIFAPADAQGVLSIAAVDEKGKHSYFSSWGPSADGRIKPDIAAQGTNTVYASMMAYDVGMGEGTSYACPVMAGMVASLKQAFPNHQNEVIKQAIKESGNQFDTPDSALGFGIPDFLVAYTMLLDSNIYINKMGKIRSSKKVIVHHLHILLEAGNSGVLEVEVFNLFGKKLYEYKEVLRPNVFNKISIPFFENYRKGVYALKVKLNNTTYWEKVLI